MFDSLVSPILTYGSEVWGASKSGLQELDRVFLRYMRCVLRVKATTSKHQILLFMVNVDVPPNHLNRLHEQGFTNWITKALDLAKPNDIDIKCKMYQTML